MVKIFIIFLLFNDLILNIWYNRYVVRFGDFMKVLLIIPAYNEEKSILKVYKNISKYNSKHNTKYDIIVINDGSSDSTEQILIDNNIPHISLIDNLGIGGAVQTGYMYASLMDYDVAVQFDGDGQHDVSYVDTIVKPIINSEADMVIGSRFVDSKSSEFKSSFLRRVGINLISFFIKLVSGKKIYDTTSGFRAVNRKLIKLFSKYYPSEYPEPVSSARILKRKYVIREVPVSMNERDGGISSIRAWKNFYYMFNVLISIIIVGLEGKRNE